jgi:hypothetical protein
MHVVKIRLLGANARCVTDVVDDIARIYTLFSPQKDAN